MINQDRLFTIIIVVVVVIVVLLLIMRAGSCNNTASQGSGSMPNSLVIRNKAAQSSCNTCGNKNSGGGQNESIPRKQIEEKYTKYIIRANADPKIIYELHGIKPKRVFELCNNSFSARLAPAAFKTLTSDSRVVSIEPDVKVHICGKHEKEVEFGHDTDSVTYGHWKCVKENNRWRCFQQGTKSSQSSSWEIARIGADKSSTKSGDGQGNVVGVEVFILDTGINKDSNDLNVAGGTSFVKNERSWNDLHGHGTFVSGVSSAVDNSILVVGVAPGAKLYAVKVLNRRGSGSFSSVLSGVNWVIKRKKANPNVPMVINMSLGGNVGTDAYNSLDLGLVEAINNGIIVVVAAGNESDNALFYSPAHVREAITVGAYDSNNNFASFSNYGDIVDILAPGVKIKGITLGDNMSEWNGTSFSTPLCSGTAAIYLSNNPNASHYDVKDALIQAGETAMNQGLNSLINNVPDKTTNLSIWAGYF